HTVHALAPSVNSAGSPSCTEGDPMIEFASCPAGHPRSPQAALAQLVEQRTENPRVTGSSPVGGTSPISRYPGRLEFRTLTVLVSCGPALYPSVGHHSPSV